MLSQFLILNITQYILLLSSSTYYPLNTLTLPPSSSLTPRHTRQLLRARNLTILNPPAINIPPRPIPPPIAPRLQLTRQRHTVLRLDHAPILPPPIIPPLLGTPLRIRPNPSPGGQNNKLPRPIFDSPPLVNNLHLHLLPHRRPIRPLQLKALAAVLDAVRDSEAVRQVVAHGPRLVRRAEEAVAGVGGGAGGGDAVGFREGEGLVVFAADGDLAGCARVAEIGLPAAGGFAAGWTGGLVTIKNGGGEGRERETGRRKGRWEKGGLPVPACERLSFGGVG